MQGWIKLSREITDHWIWQDADRLKWWLDLLMLAAWEETKQLAGSKVIALKRGQLIASIAFLTKRWGKNHNTVIDFLKTLQREGMITKRSERNISIITICNYADYQGADNLSENLKDLKPKKSTTPTDNKADNPTDTPADNQADREQDNKADNPTDTNKEIKKIRNKESSSLQEKEGGTPPSPLGAEAPKAPEPSKEEKKPQEKPKEKKQATIPFAKIKDLWNELCPSYPKMMVMSDPRKNKIRLRVQEMGGIDKALPTLEKIFKAAENSNFMKGDNKRGWKASFDWIFENDKNWVKVWEGNYENKPKDTHLTTTQNRNYNGTTTKHSTTADSYEARQQWLKDFVEDRLNNPRQEPDIEGNY